MTARERVFKALKHEETDFVPYNVLFETEDVRERFSEYPGARELLDKIDNHFLLVSPSNLTIREPGVVWVDEFGTTWEQANIRHVKEFPLKEPSLKGYKFPDFTEDRYFEDAAKALESSKDKFRIFALSWLLWERGWALRGYEQLLMDSVERPQFVEELFDRLTEFHLATINKAISLFQLDAIAFGDDYGTQKGLLMQPERWRKLFKPRLRKLYGLAKENGLKVYIHSCGDVSSIVEDFIEMGVDILNPFQPEPMDVYAVKKAHGERITFNGGIGTQHLLPLGTPEEIKAEVRKCKRLLGKGGGYVLESTKQILSDVPNANIKAYIEAVLE